MYVATEKHGIVNLTCYPRIDVVTANNSWVLHAFRHADVIKSNFEGTLSGVSLATFDEEIEANYSYCNLFSSLESGKSTWDPKAVGSFSDLWEKVKQEIPSVTSVPQASLEKLELSISGLQEITIAYPRRGASGGGPLGLPDEEPIANKLKELLKAKDSRGEVWSIHWKSSDGES